MEADALHSSHDDGHAARDFCADIRPDHNTSVHITFIYLQHGTGTLPVCFAPTLANGPQRITFGIQTVLWFNCRCGVQVWIAYIQYTCNVHGRHMIH